MSENNIDIRFKAFLSKLNAKGKFRIKLPMKEKDAQKQIVMLKELLEKGMISDKGYDERVKELNEQSLDEEMYKEFYELIKS